MNEDEPHLSLRERQAIEAIGRELDREFGNSRADPGSDGTPQSSAPRVPPRRESSAWHIALAVGAGTLPAASLIALTTYTAPSGPAPVPDAPPLASTVVSDAEAPRRPDPAPIRARRSARKIVVSTPLPKVSAGASAAGPPAVKDARRPAEPPSDRASKRSEERVSPSSATITPAVVPHTSPRATITPAIAQITPAAAPERAPTPIQAP